MSEERCRCGWDGTGDHPCHYKNYTCRKPAKERLYLPSMKFSLAGAQLKFSMSKTFACDECWEDFNKLLKKHHEEEAANSGVPSRAHQ